MPMTYPLIALKSYPYAGRRIAVGQRFDVRSFSDAKLLKALGMAVDAESEQAPSAPQQNVIDPEPEPEPVTPDPVAADPDPDPVTETVATEPEPEAEAEAEEEPEPAADPVAFETAEVTPEPEANPEPPKRRRYRHRDMRSE